MARALFLLLVAAPLAVMTPASAQAVGGIQIAPVMVTMTGEHNIASLRLRNGRDRPVSFEIDSYAWTQNNGQDVLTPTQDLIVAPGVFEIPAGGEQIVRLGVTVPAAREERAYRIVMRELPSPLPGGNVLGFTLEMSLPVFVTPVGARPILETRTVQNGPAPALAISNTGSAHTQILALSDSDAGILAAPHYLLAGASAVIPLPPFSHSVRLSATAANGAQLDRVIHVEQPRGAHPG